MPYNNRWKGPVSTRGSGWAPLGGPSTSPLTLRPASNQRFERSVTRGSNAPGGHCAILRSRRVATVPVRPLKIIVRPLVDTSNSPG
jgi:hypothetical protein